MALEDDVVCGPGMVCASVYKPRSAVVGRYECRPTLVRSRAGLGANCTMVCGVTIVR